MKNFASCLTFTFSNFDETGFSFDRDVAGMFWKRVMTERGTPTNFQMSICKYQHLITILARVFPDGKSIAPVIVFRGEHEPPLKSPTVPRKALNAARDPQILIWGKDASSVNKSILKRWIDFFAYLFERVFNCQNGFYYFMLPLGHTCPHTSWKNCVKTRSQ